MNKHGRSLTIGMITGHGFMTRKLHAGIVWTRWRRSIYHFRPMLLLAITLSVTEKLTEDILRKVVAMKELRTELNVELNDVQIGWKEEQIIEKQEEGM